MSQSTSSTFPPFCARTIAVFTLVVVLPSWGRALVIKMILGGALAHADDRHRFDTEAEAHQALARLGRSDPALSRELQVVPMYEVTAA